MDIKHIQTQHLTWAACSEYSTFSAAARPLRHAPSTCGHNVAIRAGLSGTRQIHRSALHFVLRREIVRRDAAGRSADMQKKSQRARRTHPAVEAPVTGQSELVFCQPATSALRTSDAFSTSVALKR